MQASTKILVTGASGFLGAHLVHKLCSLYAPKNIHILVRSTSQLTLLGDWTEKVNVYYGSINDRFALEAALDGVTKVYHCAAMVSYHPKDKKALIKNNVEGTATLVDILLDLPEKVKLVHVSSTAAIGRLPKDIILDEKKEWVWNNLASQYGVSKHLAEMEVWRGIAEGLDAVIVNPGMILGPGDWNRGTQRFFKLIDDGIRFYPVGTNGFVDVRDVVQAMILLMEGIYKDERYLLIGANISFKTFFEKIAMALDVTPPSIAANSVLRSLAWRLSTLKGWLTASPSLITKETVENSARHIEYDHQRSLRINGFSYRPIETTIEEVAAAYKQFKNTGETILFK